MSSISLTESLNRLMILERRLSLMEQEVLTGIIEALDQMQQELDRDLDALAQCEEL